MKKPEVASKTRAAADLQRQPVGRNAPSQGSPGRGRPRCLSIEQRHTLEQLRVAHPLDSLAELALKLETACGARASRATLSEELRSLGYRQRRARPPETRQPTREVPAPPALQTPVRVHYTAKDRPRVFQLPGGRPSYPSDLTDEEWAVLAPLVPPAKPGGHPRTVDMREIFNGIFYLARTGCQWRQLPHDFGPWSTVHDYFRRWRLSGEWERMNRVLREKCRVAAGRQPTPSAAIIDSQSSKTTEKGGSMVMMQESM